MEIEPKTNDAHWLQIDRDWKRVRGLIEHEDTLINQRVTWMISINAFLFAGYFLSQRIDNGSLVQFKELLLLLIPLFGIAITLTISNAVWAAMKQVRAAQDWWVSRLDEADNPIVSTFHPKLTGITPNKKFDHDFLISIALPGWLALAWGSFLLIVLEPKTIEISATTLALIAVLLPIAVMFLIKLGALQEKANKRL